LTENVRTTTVTKKSISYKGKRISVVEVQGAKQLFLDSEHIPVKVRGRSGPYWSRHLPYVEFPTLEQLGRAIVDYRALDEKKKTERKTR